MNGLELFFYMYCVQKKKKNEKKLCTNTKLNCLK